ncbi:hypothetical protein BDN72DRAFT_962095 [Pluteus cervinus]|uniref:Uncharacterized protein n=1 Tax=Pluteus cervinus TaxID=181527 RepID=A0ACD3AJT3_9AGAR|nr:hypothetical protein BDN72DRAFT_962095 [Pluteus cervinus]
MAGTDQNHPQPTVDQDEDLDELDGRSYRYVLDDFNAPSSPSINRAPGRPRTNTRVDARPVSIPGSGPNPGSSTVDQTAEVDEGALSEEFAKELAKGMESLMRELVSGTQTTDTGTDDSKDHVGSADGGRSSDLLEETWKRMLLEEVNSLGSTGDGTEASNVNATPSSSNNFQEKIKQAAERLRESESNLKTESSRNAGPNANSIESLLASLGDLGLGEGDEETELADFLENMMGQLMSKDVLYDPLQELSKSFPPYLENPPKPLQPEDKKRFESQLSCIQKLLRLFDEPTYNENDPATSKRTADLMSELQTYGQPPAEIMGPMPALGADGVPEKCTIA